MNLFNGIFGKIEPGLCRLSMNGEIAVRTKNGYKAYSIKTGRLTNCDSFVFDIGQEFFFVVPTNKVAVGDIILVNGKPRPSGRGWRARTSLPFSRSSPTEV